MNSHLLTSRSCCQTSDHLQPCYRSTRWKRAAVRDVGKSLGTTGAEYDVSNTTGANSFPTVGLQMCGNVGWAFDAFSAQLFVNYTGSYRNWGSPKNPITTDPVTNNPIGGGDPVKANVTFDLNLAYEFNDGILGNDQVSLNIRNLFDKTPPFYNSANGYDANVANPLGRIVTISLASKF